MGEAELLPAAEGLPEGEDPSDVAVRVLEAVREAVGKAEREAVGVAVGEAVGEAEGEEEGVIEAPTITWALGELEELSPRDTAAETLPELLGVPELLEATVELLLGLRLPEGVGVGEGEPEAELLWAGEAVASAEAVKEPEGVPMGLLLKDPVPELLRVLLRELLGLRLGLVVGEGVEEGLTPTVRAADGVPVWLGLTEAVELALALAAALPELPLLVLAAPEALRAAAELAAALELTGALPPTELLLLRLLLAEAVLLLRVKLL